jgi:predicted AAA+ superfamily ATPase
MKRTFSSYGSIDIELHYYAPRETLIEQAYTQLLGQDPSKGGHYITVWAPRQTGKTWLMQQVVRRIKERDDFEVAILTMQSAKEVKGDEGILSVLVKNLRYWFDKELPDISRWDELPDLFTDKHFSKPVILILDEFDAIREEFINKFANEFRS